MPKYIQIVQILIPIVSESKMSKQKSVKSNSSKTQHEFEIFMEFGHKARLKDAHTEVSLGRGDLCAFEQKLSHLGFPG